MDFAISSKDIMKYTSLTGYKLYTHQKRKQNMIKLIRKILPPGKRILDIGSANGDMSTELSILNYKVDGIEPLRESYENAKSLSKKYNQNIEFRQTRIEDLDRNKKYDLLVMGEVLEHFYKPDKILKKMKEILNPNGKILVTVPNVPSLRNRLKFGLLGIFPDNNPEHKYHFDRKRFLKIVTKAEYKILFFETKFTNLYLKTNIITKMENVSLFWFNKLFKYSGDAIFAIISPKV
jgi:2-polyprenyl-3-methyl-5-hydroxy-6-metoxy-1,4-benzoquinol methylase